jgi:hypothetical protein
MGAAGSTNTFQWNNGGAFAGGGVGSLRKVDTNNVTNNNGLSDASNVFFGQQCGTSLSHATENTMFGAAVAPQYAGGDYLSFFGSNILVNVNNTASGISSSIFGTNIFGYLENNNVCVFGNTLGIANGAAITDPIDETCVFGTSSFNWLSGESYTYQIREECVFGHGTKTDIADTDANRRRNVFFGTHNFSQSDQPDSIVTLGYGACYFTNGNDFRQGFSTSTVIGAKAMSDSSLAQDHLEIPITLIGHEAGFGNQNTRFSTFIGFQSGYKFRAGIDQTTDVVCNTFIGYQISADTSGGGFEGRFNTFIGYRVGYSANCASNVGIGYHALLNLSSGGGANNNTVIGNAAGASIVGNGQQYNVLIGSGSNISASNCVGIGQTVGISADGGCAVGQQSSVSGARGTALGRQCINSGANNTLAGSVTTTGTNNVFLALDAAGGGAANNSVAIGYSTLNNGVAANDNVAIGRGTLNGLIAANDSNVAIGAAVFNNGQIGRTVAIGYAAGVSSIGGGTLTCSQSVFIGYRTLPRTGTAPAGDTQNPANVICLGNSSITNIYAQVTSITALSDRRDKTNINPINLGIEFIKKLNPVTFTWDMRDGGLKDIDSCGFVAQDVIEVVKEFGAENLEIAHGDGGEQMMLSEWKIFYAVVQGIKELSARNKFMREKLDLAGY